jgi:predicted DNA-binding transcriptional regulator AlpA
LPPLDSSTFLSTPPARFALDDDVLLTAAQTRARFGDVSAMSLWRWCKDPRVAFPQPVKISQRNFWRVGDLRKWQAAQTEKAARDTIVSTTL